MVEFEEIGTLDPVQEKNRIKQLKEDIKKSIAKLRKGVFLQSTIEKFVNTADIDLLQSFKLNPQLLLGLDLTIDNYQPPKHIQSKTSSSSSSSSSSSVRSIPSLAFVEQLIKKASQYEVPSHVKNPVGRDAYILNKKTDLYEYYGLIERTSENPDALEGLRELVEEVEAPDYKNSTEYRKDLLRKAQTLLNQNHLFLSYKSRKAPDYNNKELRTINEQYDGPVLMSKFSPSTSSSSGSANAPIVQEDPIDYEEKERDFLYREIKKLETDEEEDPVYCLPGTSRSRLIL